MPEVPTEIDPSPPPRHRRSQAHDMRVPPGPAPCDDGSSYDYHDAYKYFANRLRLWLATFGIGALALIASNERLTELLTPFEAFWITLLFVIGAFFQAGYVALHKWTMWEMYLREINSSGENQKDEDTEEKRSYKIAKTLCDSYVPDIVSDVFAIIAYIIATLWLIRIASIVS